MEVEIISVGSELLCGKVRDLNAPFIALKLTELGFDIVKQTIVGDYSEDLTHLLQDATERADLVIITGGLGPTTDDITRETVADSCNAKLVVDNNSINHIENLIKKAHSQKYIKCLKQAMIPEGSTVMHNSIGTAQGFIVNTTTRSKIFCLPGVPTEMKLMFDEGAIPYILKEVGERKKRYSKLIKTFGISESMLDQTVKKAIKPNEHLSYSTLVNDGVVSIHITIRDSVGLENSKANSILNDAQERICKELGVSVFSKDKQSLEDVVSELLKKNNLKLATAESCTGGLVSSLLTDIPGSSDFFSGGVISYSTNVKQEILNIPKKLIDEYGVISAEVAKAMASGVRECIQADVGLAVTGNAGPTNIERGADRGKSVGLVYVATATTGNSDYKEYRFFGSRLDIKRRAANAALHKLRLCILEKQT
ncbi:MAG: competence/damage-inducible protein A [Candidatus Brocadiaceae bacterium]|nr:competence/damage-inducible protein A [Candidatus Brocadiaceae bacterium]